MMTLLSPDEIWQDIIIDESNYDESITKEFDSDIANYKELYFNGRKTVTGQTRIFAVLALPKKVKNPSVILLCHDSKSSIDYEYIDFFINLGYAVFMCDTYGKSEGRKYTFYPNDIDYANKVNISDENRYGISTARECATFEWTLVNRYAFHFLKSIEEINSEKIVCVGIREGAITSWHLAYLEPELKACITLFYAGWNAYGDLENVKDDDVKSKIMAYIAGFEIQSYSQIAKVPMLFLTSSNDTNTFLDKEFDTMARVNGAITSLMQVSHNRVNKIGFDGTRNLKLWLKIYLEDEDIIVPSKPILSFDSYDNNLMAKCSFDNMELVKKVNVHFAEFGKTTPYSMCWFARSLHIGGNDYIGQIDANSTTGFLYCYANVEYKNGFTISTNLVELDLNKMDIKVRSNRDNLIYNGIMKYDTFTGIKGLERKRAADTFVSVRDIFVKEGADGILGISSKANLATFKLSNSKFMGKDDELLSMDIYSKQQQTIRVLVYTNFGNDNQEVYSAELLVQGGELWQNFKLKKNNFTTANNKSLEHWEGVALLMYSSKRDFVLNNLLWL